MASFIWYLVLCLNQTFAWCICCLTCQSDTSAIQHSERGHSTADIYPNDPTIRLSSDLSASLDITKASRKWLLHHHFHRVSFESLAGFILSPQTPIPRCAVGVLKTSIDSSRQFAIVAVTMYLKVNVNLQVVSSD
ncbi:hypothetical protein C8Q75DRAFT_493902 [Abortiporus biennis]|nr:hypothetical protein C8Q75DRAFT_493902 [Abortiporus biennis]